MGIPWKHCMNTVVIHPCRMGMVWEHRGNTMAILLEYHGNSFGGAVGMLWECSGNTMGGKHGSTLGVLGDVGIACGNTPGVS